MKIVSPKSFWSRSPFDQTRPFGLTRQVYACCHTTAIRIETQTKQSRTRSPRIIRIVQLMRNFCHRRFLPSRKATSIGFYRRRVRNRITWNREASATDTAAIKRGWSITVDVSEQPGTTHTRKGTDTRVVFNRFQKKDSMIGVAYDVPRVYQRHCHKYHRRATTMRSARQFGVD